MIPPLVSILIPAYNAEHWIADTIRSALDQTWPRIEIIVINDGSTDATFEAARQFASEKVTVVTQSNQGAAATRNSLLALSRGDYIQWLDADDLLSPGKIARQLEALDQSGQSKWTLLSSAWGYFYYRHTKASFEPTALWSDLTPSEFLRRKMGQNLHMQTATWLVSRELTEKAGPWDARLWVDDDGEYFCRVLLACEKVKFVAGRGVYYRATGSSSLSYIGRSNRKAEAQFLSMKVHIDSLRSLDDSAGAREACVHYLQNWSIHFYPDRADILTQMKALAESLGGQLHNPTLSWKYAWIRRLFGWDTAKRVQSIAPTIKWDFVRWVDKHMARREAATPIE